VTGENGTATIYQPQVISWPDRRTLNARVAMGITPTGAKTPILGVIEVAFDTRTELAERTVILTDPKLISSRFPSADTAQAAQIEGRIKSALTNLPPKTVPLATLVMSLREQAEKPPEVALDNTPPQIFVSARPASLVIFDGEPVLAPLAGTSLSFAVNTNWDVFSDSSTRTWYLLNNGGWLAAPDAKGPWMPAGKLPPSFAALPADANFADVKKQIPGRPIAAKDVPTIFVSTKPATIIVTNGPPQYVAIPGTSLQYATNTDAALFRDTSGGRVYYLVSGRWFSAASLDGPWTFATEHAARRFRAHSRERSARLCAGVGPRHGAGAGSSDRSADSATGDAEPRFGEARGGLRGRAAVRPDPGHADAVRGQHVVQRDPDRRRLLLVLPGRVVRGTRGRRAMDADAHGTRGGLHDSAIEPPPIRVPISASMHRHPKPSRTVTPPVTR
jgi:hypothetical protein